ncbi:phosphodiester glycosidase family protein [Sedimentibacter sp. MB31-C6]|uniref:phosphodiester glycosidase family protein n=1 Tax=Sedimentibacter sp. MB31-C6 TaxID=3109366 RepID=UPI002DDD2386|nr:phosphodiester glycosidase family protein [Sedimentibacter sp. MB36-C1]WSI04773.1 phosphodiester glycosidase family protein [Sedimentibacter sp. MB36-C1]
MRKTKVTSLIIIAIIITSTVTFAYGASTAYTSNGINGTAVNYVTVNINDENLKPVILQANNQINSTQSLSDMAQSVGVLAAVNGTYFEAYEGVPVPWGMIIKDGKLLHAGGGAQFGITSDNKFLVDNLSFKFVSYADGKLANYIWRINHPSTENEAITVFTPEYGTVSVETGGKAVLVDNGVITGFAVNNFEVPSNGYAILFNPGAVEFMYDRYQIGMEAEFTSEIVTKHTNSEDWDNVICGLGAGPSLVINGQVTANGENEGFFEDKINTASAGRSFIGATSEGKILMGNIGAATLKEAAAICESLDLVNAMCLDGGWSSALYYSPMKIATEGRDINNGLGFIESTSSGSVEEKINATPNFATILINGNQVAMEAYNIGGNNYFKLRDLAMALNDTEKNFQVGWDDSNNAISLASNVKYTPIGGELVTMENSNNVDALETDSKVYLDSVELELTAYNINNSNYFKLRDLGKALNFFIGWDDNSNTIKLDTTSEYVK